MSTEKLKAELIAAGSETKARELSRFFKTGKGEYGEGDKFIGVTVPANRAITRRYLHLPASQLVDLLRSEIHEVRLSALIGMVEQYKSRHTSEVQRQEIVDTYIANTRYINNWDLVDLSAPQIVGQYLLDKERDTLYKLTESESLWNNRIAIVSTLTFIRNNDLDDTYKLSLKMMNHQHDLMHKSIGWMLREAGKRDEKRLYNFVMEHKSIMPRTMLRYSIEKFTPDIRKELMK